MATKCGIYDSPRNALISHKWHSNDGRDVRTVSSLSLSLVISWPINFPKTESATFRHVTSFKTRLIPQIPNIDVWAILENEISCKLFDGRIYKINKK